MLETARFLENCIGVLAEEAEASGLSEVARLLKLASQEARVLAELMDDASEDECNRLRLH